MIHPYVLPGISITQTRIINAICKEYQANPKDIWQRTRKREISEPRQIICTFLKIVLKHSNEEISKKFGFNHSNISYCVKQTSILYETNSPYRNRIDRIITELFSLHSEREWIKRKLLEAKSSYSRKRRTRIRVT